MKVGMGVVYKSIYVSWCLKQLYYRTKELKNKAILSLKQYWMCCYVIISSNNNINNYIKLDSEISSLQLMYSCWN